MTAAPATPATPATAAEQDSAPSHRLPAATRLRLVAGCVLLVGLAFVQAPGFLVADTKFDLVAGPGDFLSRALHLWDAEGAFGQVQNQAYGYLWPMGPFFLLGDLLGAPGWAVQRAWQGLVLCVAFVGAARLGRALGIRSDVACLTAGAAYALAPRMLTTLGPTSIEAWPAALTPWVLLPLVIGATRGSPRRAAALSALAVAMVGGVNAAATFAVLPLGVLWVLTSVRGPRRRAFLLWWPAFTALGTLWWLVPLFLLGAYSPPFLDYIETSAATTLPTTLVDTLRGTSHWVPYVDPASAAGGDLLTTGHLVLNSGVVMLVGFVGLLDRSNPHRRFLALGLATGVVMVTAGHLGSVEGWFAADLHALLDGALTPLRNVHKFDPVVRLPLVLGLAWALDRVLSTDPGAVRPRLERVAFTGMTLLAVAVAALPALQTRLAPEGASLDVPRYWEETADYLAEESEGGVALVVPGSSFATYAWGSPRDEPMQWLAGSRWAVRNVIPLAPGGNIRMLDEVERRLSQGDGSAALTSYLERAGVTHLVVRNDLAPASDPPDPALVHEAIAASPGLEPVAEFGPEVGGDAHLDTEGGRVVVNSGAQARYPAVEVFAVDGSAAVTADRATVVAGGPEDLLDLLDLGLVGSEPTVLGADVPDLDLGALPTHRIVLTDGLRDRERDFARIHDGYGPVRVPGEPRRTSNVRPDYTIGEDPAGVGDQAWRTTARLDGADSLTASSSASDAGASGGAVPGFLPAAALDGDPATAWRSGTDRAGTAWWRLDVGSALPDSVTLTGGRTALDNQSVRVVTAAGTTATVLLGPGEVREVALPEGDASTWLRVENGSEAGSQMSIAEVALPGVAVERRLVLPQLPAEWGAPDAVVMRAARDARTGCVTVLLAVRCGAGRAVPSEEQRSLRRVVPMTRPASYDAELTVLPRASRALDRLIQRALFVRVNASSRAVPDPRGGPVAAVDGDPGTTWLAAADDERPSFTVRWLERRTVDGIALETDADSAAAAPRRVVVRWPGGSRQVDLVDGRASFPAVTVKRLRIEVLRAEVVSDVDFNGRSRPVPVGISELDIDGAALLPLPPATAERDLRCGSGPTLHVGEERVPTAVTASPAQLFAGGPVPAVPCGGARIDLEAGENVVDAVGTRRFEVASLVLEAPADVAAPAATETPLDVDGPVGRGAPVDADDRFLVLRENANPGWVGSAEGSQLEPVVVDGWQQGFVLPPGGEAAAVDIGYEPDRTYRAGLLGGALGLVLLGAAVLLVGRRWTEPAVPHPVAHRVPHRAPVAARALAPALWVVAGLVAGVVAGWVGVLVAVGAGALALALDRWAAGTGPLLLSIPCLVATIPYVVSPWGSADGWAGSSAWPHYLVLVPLVSAVVLAAEPRRRVRDRDEDGDEDRDSDLSRSAGRSTNR